MDSLENLYLINSTAAATLNRSLTQDQYLSAFTGSLNKKLGEILNLGDDELDQFIKIKKQIFANHYNGNSVKQYPFTPSLLNEASLSGELWILSTAPEEHIRVVLQKNHLFNRFSKIIGQSQEPKSTFLSKAVKESERTFFITDTVGDLLEANSVDGVTSIGVTWGFHKEDVLKLANPSFVAHNPEDVINYIKG